MASLASLQVRDGQWMAAPNWARSLVGLGTWAGTRLDGAGRLIGAVACPTRAYAAALCAMGVVISRARLESEDDPGDHLEALRELPNWHGHHLHSRRLPRFAGASSKRCAQKKR